MSDSLGQGIESGIPSQAQIQDFNSDSGLKRRKSNSKREQPLILAHHPPRIVKNCQGPPCVCLLSWRHTCFQKCTWWQRTKKDMWRGGIFGDGDIRIPWCWCVLTGNESQVTHLARTAANRGTGGTWLGEVLVFVLGSVFPFSLAPDGFGAIFEDHLVAKGIKIRWEWFVLLFLSICVNFAGFSAAWAIIGTIDSNGRTRR